MSLVELPDLPVYPSNQTLSDVLGHALREYPRESCGLIVNARGHERYEPAPNLSPADQHFALDPLTYALIEERAEVLTIVHSHPNARAKASQADLVGCERSGLPWLIVAVPSGEFHIFRPCGYEAPLTGRQFCYGVLDCYTLMQDWYRRELGIELPPPPLAAAKPGWWKRGPNGEPPQDLYMQGFAGAGFERVEELRAGDVILIQLQADVANHCAVYLGDQTILHHVWGRLSCREAWGGYWLKHARAFVRYQPGDGP